MNTSKFFKGNSAEERSRRPSQPGQLGSYEEALSAVFQGTKNARAIGEIKGLVSASVVWYEIFAAGFHFCLFFFQFSKQIT